MSPNQQEIQSLLEKALEALRRDVNSIFSEGSSKKLSPTSARDLAVYIKILRELEDTAQDAVKSVSDDELKTLAKELLK